MMCSLGLVWQVPHPCLVLYQTHILHPQDSQYYPTTPHQPQICVYWLSGQPQALFFSSIFDFEVLLSPFLGC